MGCLTSLWLASIAPSFSLCAIDEKIRGVRWCVAYMYILVSEGG